MRGQGKLQQSIHILSVHMKYEEVYTWICTCIESKKLLIVVTVNSGEIPSDMERKFLFFISFCTVLVFSL